MVTRIGELERELTHLRKKVEGACIVPITVKSLSGWGLTVIKEIGVIVQMNNDEYMATFHDLGNLSMSGRHPGGERLINPEGTYRGHV